MITSELTRQDIVQKLQEGVCCIKYTKESGDSRMAHGTLKGNEIPKEHWPNQGMSESKSFQQNNPTLIRYFDLGANGWRSFFVDKVESIVVMP